MSSARTFLRALLPHGGLCVAWSVYFDESETRDPHLFTVAGYIFERDSCEAMEAPWNAILAEYGVPYFHMVDCAHGAGAFAGLSKSDRITMQTRIFDLLKVHMKMGLCVSFDMRLRGLLAGASFPGVGQIDPYTLCCWWCVGEVARVALREGMKDDIAYFFEAGSTHRRLADTVLSDVFMAIRYRYAGHAFITKRAAAAVQAADILAWQYSKDRKREAHGQPMRKDFQSLLDRPHRRCQFGMRLLQSTIRALNRAGRTQEAYKRSIYWSRAKVLETGQLAMLPPLAAY